MSREILKETGNLARQTAVRAAWVQWSSLGAPTADASVATSIIDPEALVLVSLAMLDEEQRLADMLAWWARVGSRLLSVQRMKVLAEAYPERVRERLGRFARSAMESKDARWRRYAAEEPLAARTRTDKEAKPPNLASASTLMLRLRAGFGVSAKADVLTFLLGIGERHATIQAIERATGYAGVTVRDAARDMALARLIRETEERPVSYYARRQPWTALLELGGDGANRAAIPPWRFWTNVFAFLAHVDELARSETAASGSEYVQSSHARDLFETHRSAFINNRLDMPDPEDYRGAAYLTSFRDTVQILSDWIVLHAYQLAS